MKKITFVLAIILIVSVSFAQTPNAFKYQTVVRDGSGQVLSNQLTGFRISILQTSSTGTVVYSEEHSVTTNQFGLVNLEIGNGSVLSGNFSNIDWQNDIYFVKTEVDINDGNGYQDMGTSQLLSVPYAMNAKTAENVFSGDYFDLTNTPTIPTNTSDLTNDSGFITSPDDADADPSNELQTISKTGSIITLSNGGGSFVDADADSTNELQTISKTGSVITLSNGGGSFVDADSDATNELQTISKTGSTVTLSNGGGSFIDENTTYTASNGINIDGSNNISLESGIVFYENPYEIVSTTTDVIIYPNINGYVEARTSATGTKDIILPINIPYELSGRNISTISIDYKCDNANSYIDAVYIYYNAGLGSTSSLYTSTINRNSTAWQSFGANINATPTGNVYVILRLNYSGVSTPNDIAFGRIRVTME
ncbi:MAG: hypothetical protein Kow0068_23870 [Marinilabiliales bacterium]